MRKYYALRQYYNTAAVSLYGHICTGEHGNEYQYYDSLPIETGQKLEFAYFDRGSNALVTVEVNPGWQNIFAVNATQRKGYENYRGNRRWPSFKEISVPDAIKFGIFRGKIEWENPKHRKSVLMKEKPTKPNFAG